MSPGISLQPGSLDELLRALARDVTGFDDRAIPDETVEALAQSLGPDALARCLARTPDVVDDVRRAVIVGETSLFRQREHFSFVEHAVVPGLRAGGRTSLRAWSAGCATGEEAWSLAATLRAALPDGTVDVLGTDVLAEHVAAAASGRCRRTSLRAPPLHPVVERSTDAAADDVAVLPDVAACTRFARHDLRDPPPGRDFDIVFCRNVLLFLARPLTQRIVENLVSALAPGGVIVFGPVDVFGAPPGLVPLGAVELTTFQRPRSASPRPAAPAPLAPPAFTGAVLLHLQALSCLERGDVDGAEHLLARATDDAPDYVPGLVQRALVLERRGDRGAAVDVMRRAQRLLAAQPGDTVLVGPEPLPARFWQESAAAFSRRHGGRA